CRGYGIKPILGAEVTMEDGSHLTLLCQNSNGYANLCRLLSAAYAHGGRLAPCLPWTFLPRHTEGVLCLTGCRKGKIAQLVGSNLPRKWRNCSPGAPQPSRRRSVSRIFARRPCRHRSR